MKSKIKKAVITVKEELDIRTGDFITKLVQEHVFNQGANYVPELNQFRISNIGYCARKIQLGKIAGHEEKPFDLKTQGIFAIGNALHEWIQKYIPKRYLVKAEQRVYYDYKDIQLTGHVDLLLMTPNGLHVNDIKSSGMKAFRNLDTYGVSKHHRAQANTYASIMKTLDYSILYVKKEDFAMKVFEFDTSEEQFNASLKKCQSIHEAIMNKVLMDKVDTEDNWECGYCNYSNICDNVVMDDLPFYNDWENLQDSKLVVKNN